MPSPRALRRAASRLPNASRFPSALLLVAVVLLASGFSQPATAAQFQKPFHQAAPAPTGMVLELENLAGAIRLTRATGKEVVVDATVHAEAGTETAARALADRLRLSLAERAGHLVLGADYPIDDYDTFYYPRPGEPESFLGFDFGSRTDTKFHGRRVTVYTAPRSGAAGLWADYTIALPAGVGASIKNAAGAIESVGVDGPLALDTGWGDIRTSGGTGDLSADTGSGDVTVRERQGSLRVDTGSGDVLLEHVAGKVSVDTGSGDARLVGVAGDIVRVDTGSGEVYLDDVRGTLSVDTGSGSVHGSRLAATGRLYADTGSGDVILAGDFGQVTSMKVSTGSGDVTFAMSGVPAVRLSISTGSGEIVVDLPETRIRHAERDELEGDLRGGGSGLAAISTGSGDVTLRGAGASSR